MAGDRFASQDQFDTASKEFAKVLEIDPNNLDARRRLVHLTREQLTRKAFQPHNQALDIGLRRDYSNFAPVANDEINDALLPVYELQALDPSPQPDADLLLDEALILKTNGQRIAEAVKVLDDAHQAAPNHVGVTAELGLLLAVPEESQRQEEGLALLRQAVQSQPNEPRYRFYLARALCEVHSCSYANPNANDGEPCAEAIREYHKAADLASARDTWSSAIRLWAQTSAMAIFHGYVRRDGDILTPKLAMPLGRTPRKNRISAPERIACQYGLGRFARLLDRPTEFCDREFRRSRAANSPTSAKGCSSRRAVLE